MNALLQQFGQLQLNDQQDIVEKPEDDDDDFFIHIDLSPSGLGGVQNRINTYMIRHESINPKTTINVDPDYATATLSDLRDTYQMSNCMFNYLLFTIYKLIY